MKALSLTQPWATAIMLGIKKIETRPWKTSYRGRIAIHAAKGFPKYAKEFASVEYTLGRIPTRLPFGCIIGFATISDIKRVEEVKLEVSAIERLYGDYSDGRFAWILTDVTPLPLDELIPYKGALGLFKAKTVMEAGNKILKPQSTMQGNMFDEQ